MEIIRFCYGGRYYPEKTITVQAIGKRGKLEYHQFADYVSMARILRLLPLLKAEKTKKGGR